MAVCEKLRQENSWLETGHRLSVGWVVARYRKHLAACPSCGSTCKHVEAVIDALDHELLGCLGELIPLCLECLKCDTERARRLLSNERKAAGFDFLPSEEEDFNAKQQEQRQLEEWFRVLKMRAGALCCLNGRIILDCEDTHDVQGNPWIRWRTQGNSAAARFVQGLSREQFLAALTARNISWSVQLHLAA